MPVRADKLGWAVVVLGAILWAVFAVILSAQGPQRIAGDVALERPPVVELPIGPVSTGPGAAATADDVIEQMARAAGVIFAGQITAVLMPPRFSGSAMAEGVVEVKFRVEQAVKGPAAGSVYTLREWAGLWSAMGGGRYRLGQRLLVFLYAPDARGMSSPVRGLDGAVPLRGVGVAPGPDDLGATAADWMVDLRWVQVQALKTYPSAVPPAGSGPVSPRPISPEPVHSLIVYPPLAGGVRSEDEAARGAMEIAPLPVRRVPILTSAPEPTEAQPLAQVIALCRQAMRGSNAAR